MVVRVVRGEPERQRQQTWRLRRELEACGIGPADDQRERVERRVADPIDFEKRIEAAQLAVMGERLGAGNIIGYGTVDFATSSTCSVGT